MRYALLVGLLSATIPACGGGDTPPPDAGGTADGGTPATDSGTPGSDSGPGTDAGALTADAVRSWVDAYAAAHPGRAGDINALTPTQVASDPDAARLLSVCGADQRPVYPRLAWEYGGVDHAWINPEASALCYCVYIPVVPSTEHWSYDAPPADRVTADVYVLFPEENPCRTDVGANQVLNCLGDPTNIEILVDTASYRDGADAGLTLSEASTELMYLEADGARVHLYLGL